MLFSFNRTALFFGMSTIIIRCMGCKRFLVANLKQKTRKCSICQKTTEISDNIVHGPTKHQEALEWIQKHAEYTKKFTVEKIKTIKTRSARK